MGDLVIPTVKSNSSIFLEESSMLQFENNNLHFKNFFHAANVCFWKISLVVIYRA